MRRVATEPEFEAIRAAGAGFIFNDFTSGADPQYNVLHAASCRWLARMNLGVAKIHFNADEDPATWINRTKGPEGIGWKRCATCGGVAGGRAATSPRPAAQQVLTPTVAPEYLVLAPGAADAAVRAWSATRLQFQPRAWQVDFKRQIAEAVSQLRARDNELLHAAFASAEGEGFDIENVLFYNVGAGCFSASCADGVRFERAFEVPAPPAGTFAHHHRYEIVPGDGGFRHWRLTRVVAELETARFRGLGTSSKPPLAWQAAKHGVVQVSDRLAERDVYAARLTLEVPQGALVNVAGIAKPLLDGLLAGLDQHDGSELDYLAGVVAGELGSDPREVADLLMTADGAVFGPRRLLWRRGAGVQWNPADDLCVAVEILVRRVRDLDWRITGTLLAAERI